ncbi:MAG: hypothetical protein ACREQ9_07955, partial [Candidatus Binatia bacterium]
MDGDGSRGGRRYCCSIDPEGRVVIMWDRSPTQEATEQAAPEGQECVEIEDDSVGEVLAREASDHWFDRAAGRFERKRDWQPSGLPATIERVGGEDVRLVPSRRTMRIDWPDPPGPI